MDSNKFRNPGMKIYIAVFSMSQCIFFLNKIKNGKQMLTLLRPKYSEEIHSDKNFTLIYFANSK